MKAIGQLSEKTPSSVFSESWPIAFIQAAIFFKWGISSEEISTWRLLVVQAGGSPPGAGEDRWSSHRRREPRDSLPGRSRCLAWRQGFSQQGHLVGWGWGGAAHCSGDLQQDSPRQQYQRQTFQLDGPQTEPPLPLPW